MTNNIYLCATLQVEVWDTAFCQDFYGVLLTLHLHEFTSVN